MKTQTYIFRATNEVSSSKWSSAYGSTCVGRLVQRQRHRIRGAAHNEHRRCSCRRLRMDQAWRRVRCERLLPYWVISTDFILGNFRHQRTTIRCSLWPCRCPSARPSSWYMVRSILPAAIDECQPSFLNLSTPVLRFQNSAELK